MLYIDKLDKKNFKFSSVRWKYPDPVRNKLLNQQIDDFYLTEINVDIFYTPQGSPSHPSSALNHITFLLSQ